MLPVTTVETTTTVDTPAPERKKRYWNSVPDEMKLEKRWLLWKYERRDGDPKLTKVPYQMNGRKASSTDPDTWATFQAVRAVYNEQLPHWDGIGFVLGDGWIGFDCDDSKDPNAPIFQRILDSYTEDSPSGMGFHVICRGTLPSGGRRKGCFEMYDDARYFTVTGDAWINLEHTVSPVMERTPELAEVHKFIFGEPAKPVAAPSPAPAPLGLTDAEILTAALRDAKFKRLWDGEWKGMYASHSEADQALVNKLVFYFGGDAGKVDAMFRRSGLMRPKWDREKYRMGTIGKALADVTEHYHMGDSKPSPGLHRCVLEPPVTTFPEQTGAEPPAADIPASEPSAGNQNGFHAGGDDDRHEPEAPVANSNAWPAPLDPAAFHGVAGEIVRALEPQTEADPVAVLLHVLVGMGNLSGRGPHFRVGGAYHFTNEIAVCVGPTSSGRKGTAKDDTFQLLRAVDETWTDHHVMSGLSSGEGLIWAVRDEIEKQEPIRGKDKSVTGYQSVIIDKGVTDKRLLVIEPEFASVLRVAGRDGNTLSAVYRQAWDSGHLRVLNKNSPVQATGAHISIIGHITKDELLMELSNNDKVNGFGNRNLWACVRRSKFLPDGGDLEHLNLQPLTGQLKRSVEFARSVGEMHRDAEARVMWHQVYRELSGERCGLFGSLTSRAEAHAMRLACIYALLDRSAEIRRCHLEAGLEVWRYCEDSARFIFGDALGNPVVDTILKALKGAPEGLTRNDLMDLFHRHRSSEEIGAALKVLVAHNLVESEIEPTGGRPTERWFAVSRGRDKREKRDKGMGEAGAE